ncbi:DUF4955 domain-containing protein [Pedobacter cryophilus]|uniref:DUF4955 domain-containing protein n=1 Tax=Pedobacter cryophilus TaxID=2571271 RepID=A0A4U1BZE6_9SPHI|nr:DUF4955 domain-containing protein [Pedobacter cryophilus]TKB96876.1 DUF4955 domain-containing protein [Pedobacter cryophilus]
MNKKLKLSLAFLLTTSIAYSQKAVESKLFAAYRADKSKSVLPDFSYAGYKTGELAIPNVKHKIFNVTDFGAVANDNVSDKVAIEAAIAAAKANGSGIILFPAGRFLINEDSDVKKSIQINASNIVFRGTGIGAGGTEIYMKNTLIPANPNQMWTTPKMFVVGKGAGNITIGKITESSNIGDFNIKLSSTKSLKAGDWLLLSMNSNDQALIDDDVANRLLDTAWALTKEGVELKIYHQVKSVNSNSVTLVQPITYAIHPKHSWTVSKVNNATQEVGFENITFSGNWQEPFVHHQSWVHDSGWSMFVFNNTFNSWMKNCRFNDLSAAAVVNSGANISFLSCEITGNPGHEAISNTGGTNILIANVKDKASQWHSFGVANASMNTVILNAEYPSTTCFESHSSQPRNTLLDNVKGGFMNGHGGGAKQNMPNHLKNLVMWNYEQTNEGKKDFEFWPSNPWFWRIPDPIIAGFTGTTTFKSNQIHHQSEVTYSKVSPNSLYEAQLTFRLGKLPSWLKELK